MDDVLTYAVWQTSITREWCMQHFIGASAEMKRYTGLASEAEAMEIIASLNMGRLRKISYRRFMDELVQRCKQVV